MLEFSRDFFEGEVRSDYYVKPYIKREWAALLEVLAEFDRVCKKHRITYFADFGTLLGAVRHGGFIPWDDDLDVVMRREDYLKFQKIAPMEFNYFEERPGVPDKEGRMYFHTPYTSKWEITPHTMVMSGRYINFEDSYLKRFHGCPFAVGIDICPLDYYPGNTEETILVLEILKSLIALVDENGYWLKGGVPANETIQGQIDQIGSIIGYKFEGETPVRLQASRLIDKLSSIYTREESDYMQNMFWHARYYDISELYKKEWYDNVRYLPFEFFEMPCPAEPEKVLEVAYGDYMTLKNYGGHGDEQLEILREKKLFGDKDVEEALDEMMKDYN